MKREFINKTDISDALIERPIGFSVGRKHFSVYPATLGKLQLISRLIEASGLNDKSTMKDVLIKAKTERDNLLRLISYSTLPGAECLDELVVKSRIRDLRKIDDVDLASLLLTIICNDKTQRIIKQYGIDIESDNMKKVLRVKKDKNTFNFGGKSIWGAIIDAACERYGWSYQYVLWGISYTNLQLLLADQVKSVFLTDAERKLVHISQDREVINADNPEEINEFIKSQSWR